MTMKVSDLKDLAIEELRKRLSDEQENLSHLRFQLATRQLESPIKVRIVRRHIARLKTVLRQKEVGAVTAKENP